MYACSTVESVCIFIFTECREHDCTRAPNKTRSSCIHKEYWTELANKKSRTTAKHEGQKTVSGTAPPGPGKKKDCTRRWRETGERGRDGQIGATEEPASSVTLSSFSGLVVSAPYSPSPSLSLSLSPSIAVEQLAMLPKCQCWDAALCCAVRLYCA